MNPCGHILPKEGGLSVRDFFLSAGDIILKALGAAAGLLAGWPEGIKALGVMMAADYLTGILTAAVGKAQSRNTGALCPGELLRAAAQRVDAARDPRCVFGGSDDRD